MRYLAAITLVALTGCGLLEESEPDIHPMVKQGVDNMRADGDCRGLQDAFDRHDEADVLGYIDDALRDAGCYD